MPCLINGKTDMPFSVGKGLMFSGLGTFLTGKKTSN